MLPGTSATATERIQIGIGLAVLAQFAARGALWAGINSLVVGIPILVWGFALILSGCFVWARGKGYSRWVGLVGVLWLVGLLILYLLPDRCPDSPRDTGGRR